jgi:hypothetical protein
VPASGRSVTAALYSAVTELADGSGSRFRGGLTPMLHGENGQDAELVTGSFAFTPVGASGPGEVTIEISQILSDGILWDHRAELSCAPGALDCEHSVLGDGSKLTTYRTHGPGADGTVTDTVYAERVARPRSR